MGSEKLSLDRNLALELVRVTESAAIAASRWMGRGDKNGADGAAVDAMRSALSTIAMDGIVVIGEGEKDEAPMLFNGERIGDGSEPKVDIAVDPIEGTTPTALGRENALSVIALSERGTMFNPGPCFYMNKIAAGPESRGKISLDLTPTENVREVAKAKAIPIREVTVVILDRPRNQEIIEEVRKAGARVHLITDGDVAAAISTAWPTSGADLLLGIGGTPEGVVSAAALKSMGGEIQGRLWPRDDAESKAIIAAGLEIDKTLTHNDLIQSENCFFAATGVTNGELLRGVRYTPTGAVTQSLVMRSKSGTVRLIESTHRLSKFSEYLSE
ncbi:MAG: class II fructose-bisphosphatase [Actinomycetota bacterium]|nr:class II fructose-bisphosphatase [Actinomycetota bacterium]